MRTLNAAAEEQKILGALEAFGQVFAFFVVGEDVFELAGDERKFLGPGAGLPGGHGAAYLREIKSEEIESGELAGEGLGGSHADLWAGVSVDGSGSFASNHRADDVADS